MPARNYCAPKASPDIGYVAAKAADEIPPMLAQGRADFSLAFAVNHIATIEAGAPSEAEIVRAIFCRYAELCTVRLLKQELETRGISRFQRCDPSTVDRHRMRELIREWIVYPFSARMREPRRPGAPR
jgi:hypothetical protein